MNQDINIFFLRKVILFFLKVFRFTQIRFLPFNIKQKIKIVKRMSWKIKKTTKKYPKLASAKQKRTVYVIWEIPALIFAFLLLKIYIVE